MSSEAKSKTYPTPQTSVVIRKGLQMKEMDSCHGSQQMEKFVKGPDMKPLSGGTQVKKTPLKFNKPTAEVKSKIIVPASESESNEDCIEKINTPWKIKNPTAAEEVGGI